MKYDKRTGIEIPENEREHQELEEKRRYKGIFNLWGLL